MKFADLSVAAVFLLAGLLKISADQDNGYDYNGAYDYGLGEGNGKMALRKVSKMNFEDNAYDEEENMEMAAVKEELEMKMNALKKEEATKMKAIIDEKNTNPYPTPLLPLANDEQSRTNMNMPHARIEEDGEEDIEDDIDYEVHPYEDENKKSFTEEWVEDEGKDFYENIDRNGMMLRGSPPNTMHSSMDSLAGPNHACRKNHSNDNAPSYYTVKWNIFSFQQCSQLCENSFRCLAVEHNGDTGRCELWNHLPKEVFPVNGYECFIKRERMKTLGYNHACRGNHANDNSRSYYLLRSADNMEQCANLCLTYDASCYGIEYHQPTKRCEIWTRPIRATKRVSGYECIIKLPLGRVTVHLQDIGDKHYSLGQWAGSKGQHRRLEGFKIDLDGGINLEYMAHIQDIGDTQWTSGYVGTKGKSQRLEGFAIRVRGEDSHKWSIHYRAHLEGVGDTRIMKDGEFCGSNGQHRRVEAIWIDLVRK